jgi:magnesium transporter
VKALILEGDKAIAATDFAALEAAHAAGKTFWVELDEKSAEATRFLEQTLNVHPLAVEDVWNDVGLPKVEDFDEYVQVIIHGLREDDRSSDEVPLELAELDILIGKTWLVTHAHDEKVCAVTPIMDEILRSSKLLKKGPAWVAHAVMDRMVDAYMPLIDRFDDQIEGIETQILKWTPTSDREVIPRIIRIKRSLQMLRRTTIYQREILLRLARAEFDEIPRELVPFYRDVYDHFARVTELVDSYRELVTSLLEAQFSMQSNRMNEIMKRLTIISTTCRSCTGSTATPTPSVSWWWSPPRSSFTS